MNHDNPHIFECRVYYEDTDVGGIVYYANYLKYMERGRTEWLRTRYQIHQKALKEADRLVFVVRDLSIDYLKPAFLDDILSIHTKVIEKRRVSITLEQTIFRGKELLTQAEVTLACIHADTQKIARLSELLDDSIILH
jgi:acyl-CoA thioester hydrolase